LFSDQGERLLMQAVPIATEDFSLPLLLGRFFNSRQVIANRLANEL